MKKLITGIMLVVLAAGMRLADAGEMKGGMMGQGMQGMMGGREGKMGMHSMMKSMMDRTVVATSDGGVVVVMGNKLTKYDKNLNLIKEVELKMDAEGMKKMMDDMMSMCPMMGKGMMGQGMMEGGDSKAAPGPEESKAASEHESHHPSLP